MVVMTAFRALRKGTIVSVGTPLIEAVAVCPLLRSLAVAGGNHVRHFGLGRFIVVSVVVFFFETNATALGVLWLEGIALVVGKERRALHDDAIMMMTMMMKCSSWL